MIKLQQQNKIICTLVEIKFVSTITRERHFIDCEKEQGNASLTDETV